MFLFNIKITFIVSVPEVQVPATEKTKSKQELSRNEHLAAVKHEGIHCFMCTWCLMMYFVLLLNIEQETKARLEMIKAYALEKIQHIKVHNLNAIKF